MIRQSSTPSGAHFAFTNRWGGVSAAPYESLNLGGHVGDDPAAVRANRDLAAKSLGLDPERVVWMNQVHGNDVALVAAPRRGAQAPTADAIVTTHPGVALAVLTADCVPVLLADPGAGVVAAAHAGRPGLVAGVVPATVESMVGLGARPERIIAAIGPSVCGGCYEVPAAMRDEVAAAVPEARASTGWGTPSVDVAAGVLAQLARIGVPVGAATSRGATPGPPWRSHICTMESADHFSYRRERTTGRLAGYVWLDLDKETQ
ncbi:peptidoglycan editing factor PgeF [Actinacidiphila oryziradicis]|uniref:peptidoglycan editing factor PgeF n=1 Tax=Actinacidiphila oryziradicis TaxID=2571141 RepID=UPI0023F41F09|nr:peptidoglycan editing factor PgeF [Actinacidiphila oryziradicis]MCW2872123.1 Polyphenol oxidase [Actinacidiphila oryziradicis]